MTNPNNLMNELVLTTMTIPDLMAMRDQVNGEVERRIAQLEQLRAGAKPARTRAPRSDKGKARVSKDEAKP